MKTIAKMKKVVLKKEDIYQGSLILVNKYHPIKSARMIDPEHLIPVDPEHRGILLEPRCATLLGRSLQAIHANGRIVPVSGYRSTQEQREIYQDSLHMNGLDFTKKYVALPNRSEHQTGLAIDLGRNLTNIDFIRPKFSYDGICGIFRGQAGNYGFVERYQKGKETITGIAHEPWHFRYVGYPHSKIMEQLDLCLEEYIDFIKDYSAQERHYMFEDSGKVIEVFYVRSVSEEVAVQLPEGKLYQVSGNNVDGFIFTLWRH